MGKTTGTTCGIVLDARDPCPEYGLRYCIFTSISGWYGDSGAPVYVPYVGSEDVADIYGHVVRFWNGTQILAVSVQVALDSGFNPLGPPPPSSGSGGIPRNTTSYNLITS